MAIDPICGMEVDERSEIRAERDGQTFFFCCQGCRDAFLKSKTAENPNDHECCHSHVKTGRSVRATITKKYFCPMCPGVESDFPGACPVCGMALERADPTAISEDEPSEEAQDLSRRFWVGFILAIPAVLLPMSEMFGISFLSHEVMEWVQFISSLPIVLWAGWPFWVRAWQSILRFQFNMFTLIFLGVSAAFFYSLVAFLFPQFIPQSFYHHGKPALYFEAAAAITVLVLLGQLLESKARSHTNSAVRNLLEHSPKTARILRADQEVDLPIEQVKIGDLLRVRPGEKIPLDGILLDGKSYVDESMISGESVPVEKSIQSKVIGGTLNQNGSFVMKVELVGSDTILSQMIRLVLEAQRTRAPIQRLADQVSSYFVPTVIAIAMITFLIWGFFVPNPSFSYALINAIAVLIIACPCALGLATPMSIMVGIGRGAGMGILIRNAEALERLEKVTTLVVDKTGTLTEGKPRVTNVVPSINVSQESLLILAASLETQSEHPLASAILNEGRRKSFSFKTVSDFQSIPGEGVIGKVEGKSVIIGRLRLLSSRGVHLDPVLLQKAEQFEANCETVIWIAEDSKNIGIISVSDPIKKTTHQAIETIHQLGIKIVMLTGDRLQIAKSIAKKLRIEEIHAEVKPADKKNQVSRLQEAGQVVAMAGDGINDAPALATADVGMAMGTGTDIAMESAAITLLKGDLQGIARAILLSRATMKNIRQNLFLAFVYNALGIPIAAGVLYPFFGILLNPIFASAAMSLSSLCVVLNALRLKRFPKASSPQF
jgi:Cu+-exporting ATPase